MYTTHTREAVGRSLAGRSLVAGQLAAVVVVVVSGAGAARGGRGRGRGAAGRRRRERLVGGGASHDEPRREQRRLPLQVLRLRAPHRDVSREARVRAACQVSRADVRPLHARRTRGE